MNPMLYVLSLAIQAGHGLRTAWKNIGKSKKNHLIWPFLIVLLAAAILPANPTSADDHLPLQIPSEGRREVDQLSLSHVKHVLDLLRQELNLSPRQTEAWKIWAAGMTEDCRRQLERKKDRRNESREAERPPFRDTTPERLTQDINRLRAEIASTEDQLRKLEATRARTSKFYEALDASQQSTFDTFWHTPLDIHTGQNIDQPLPAHPYHRPVT